MPVFSCAGAVAGRECNGGASSSALARGRLTDRPRAASRGVQAPDHLRPALQHMLRDLQERALQVELIPSSDWDLAMRGARVRVVVGRNPGWYRALFAAYPRNRSIRRTLGSRRHLRGDKYVDSVIDRKRIVQALQGLLNSGTRSTYAEDLLLIAAERTSLVEHEFDEVPF